MDGFDALTSLTFLSPDATISFLDALTTILPHHPRLLELVILDANARPPPNFHTVGMVLPRQFLDALPPRLEHLELDFHVRVDDEALQAFGQVRKWV